jgi:hypothetical protein
MKKQIVALASDEDHIVMWDMDALLSDHQDRPYQTVDTKILTPQDWLTIDPKYAMTTNVQAPIILFELPNKQLFIADGNHRLYRAVTENIPQMHVILLPQEIHLRYLFRSSVDSYFYVIDKLQNQGIFIPGFIHA